MSQVFGFLLAKIGNSLDREIHVELLQLPIVGQRSSLVPKGIEIIAFN